jgi:hypothetical protein
MEKGKRRRWLHAPSPAMLVACVALFVALGGTSYAAIKLPANSVGTQQLKKNAVIGVKVKDGSLTGAKLADGSVAGSKLTDGSVGGADLAAGAVTPDKLGATPGVRLERKAAESTDSGTSRWVAWDTVDYDVGSMFVASNPAHVTAPIAGRYLITATVRWEANPTGRRALAIDYNSSLQIARSNVSAYASAAYNPEQTATTVYRLNAGDNVGVYVMQDSGASLNLMTGVQNGVTFSVQWIAP